MDTMLLGGYNKGGSIVYWILLRVWKDEEMQHGKLFANLKEK
jgi:hypothetical protein